jgi:spore maturation protein CgeB
MRLLMTNSVNEYMLAPCYARHLCGEPGITLDYLYYVDEFEQYYRHSFLNKAIYRIYPAAILDTINKRIIEKIEAFKPDVIWIFKGMEIYPETLEYARKRGIRLVNYNPDHPFKFESKGAGNSRVSDSLHLFDLHLSYSRTILKDLEIQYNIKGEYLPFGFDLTADMYQQAIKAGELNRVAFVGYADEKRKQVIEQLIDAGLEVDVYGPAWKRFIQPSARVHIADAVYQQDFWSTLRKYRVQVNIFRSQNFNSHNMRSFEIPAIGGIMLSPYTDEQIEFFQEGAEAFFYRNAVELVEKAKHILALSAAGATEIRVGALERSIKSDYSYKNRSQLALRYIRSLIK